MKHDWHAAAGAEPEVGAGTCIDGCRSADPPPLIVIALISASTPWGLGWLTIDGRSWVSGGPPRAPF